MENYIGVREIAATPMTRLEYNNYRGWDLPEEEKGMENDPGYLIENLNSTNSNHAGHKGYISWSPKEVFEEVYRKTEGMTFGLAIEAMKKGKLVARKGWNGKGMFVCKQVPAEIYCNIIPKMSSLPERAKGILFDRDKSIFYKNQMIIVKPDNTIDSWVASSSDTFADDWMIVD